MTSLKPHAVATAVYRAAFQTPYARSALLSGVSTGILRYEAHATNRCWRRTFLTSGPQTLDATRILQYPSKTIFEVISDVTNYKTFVPYCVESQVTKYSKPAKDGKKYPEEAKLVIGFNDQVADEFWSRVYCVPNRTVEAVSGATLTSLPRNEIEHHNPRPSSSEDPSQEGKVLSQLATKWTVMPCSTSGQQPDQNSEQTEVTLHLEFRFANPFYAALSGAAAPKVAEKMIEAFERRVKLVVEGSGNV